MKLGPIPQGTAGGFAVKAGDLIGHPGRYDSLNACTSGTRMAHIEVFCDGGIRQFIKSGRDWVRANCAHEDRWSELGLSPEPTILRVERGTTLYPDHANGRSGKDPKQTDVVQAYRFAALPQDDGHRFMEKDPGSDGTKRRWWKVDSADVRGNPIRGWVREQSFEGGRVTREFSQSWIDFECHDEDHDPTHTIFATTGDYVDYALGTEASGAGSLGKLSPLMAAIYRALYPGGDGLHAAHELCSVGQSPQRSGFPWASFRASRFIAKHESEWANPAKWQALVSAIEERTGHRPEHEEEKKRIAKLVWWDEVAAGVPGFPGSDVYHINPIGLVGSFLQNCDCKARFEKISKIVLLNEGGFVDDPNDSGGATNKGIAWDTWKAYAEEDVGVEPTLDNLKALTDAQAKIIYLKRYWEPRGFCGFVNEKTALNVYDWTITSYKAPKKIQELLVSDYSHSIAIDNHLTKALIDYINAIEDQEEFVQKVGAARKQYYTSLAYDDKGKPTKNHRFLVGWLSRVNRCLSYGG
ncbi:lysozyme family protein [Paraburkholderia youngii]